MQSKRANNSFYEFIIASMILILQICRDKKKEFAPSHAAYQPFGVDVFLSHRKVDHIARFVELPAANYTGKLPPILVVNVQVNSSLASPMINVPSLS